MAEAHSLFVGENPTIAVGKSKFAELRLAEFLLSSKMPCNICGCIYHANIALLLEELYRKLPENFPHYGEEFVKSYVCNTSNKKCMTSNWVLCKTKFQKTYLDEIKEKYFRAAANLLSTLQHLLTKFLLHYFISKLQTEAYNACRLTATAVNFNTAMVQMDFSEDSSVYQDEVSSAHSKENRDILYIVMIWFGDQIISIVLLSDSNNHDKTTVVPCTMYVLNCIKEHFGDNVHDIEIWTDGRSSQFKNKYIFEFIGINLPQLIAYRVFWNYSATSHGKGAIDGVVGTIK